MSVLARNNVTVSKDAGSGARVMIFAHGYGCDQHMWRFITPAFRDTYQIVLFDHVGAGRSDLRAYDRKKYSSLQGYADDVVEICAALDIWDGIFVGHSVSAMIGVLAAIKDPRRFGDLILIGPSPRYIDDDGYHGGFSREDIVGLLEFQESNYLGWSRTIAPVIMGTPDRPQLSEELANSFCRTDPAIAKQFAAVTFLSDNRADLPKVQTPSLIIQSREDAIAPPVVGQYVHDHLPGSHLTVIDAIGHCPHLSAPEATVAAMKTYLERSLPAPPV
jgi:sigma-B regulation protein RsbQ